MASHTSKASESVLQGGHQVAIYLCPLLAAAAAHHMPKGRAVRRRPAERIEAASITCGGLRGARGAASHLCSDGWPCRCMSQVEWEGGPNRNRVRGAVRRRGAAVAHCHPAAAPLPLQYRPPKGRGELQACTPGPGPRLPLHLGSRAGTPGVDVGGLRGLGKCLLLPVARPLLQASAASGCLLLGIGQRGEEGDGG